MAQIADDGTDFQLISVPHHCNKADKYLSRVTTWVLILELCVLSANGACLLWFFLHGASVFLPHLKTFARLFMPFFKIAIPTLNPISLFWFVDSLMISGYLF